MLKAESKPVAKIYFDSAKAELLLIEMIELRKSLGYNKPNAILCNMIMELADGILRKSNYKNYESDLKEDMKSRALLDFCKYGHNYNASKSKSANACFSFLTFCFENSYKAVLKQHYKAVNIDAVCLNASELIEEYYQLQLNNEASDDLASKDEMLTN